MHGELISLISQLQISLSVGDTITVKNGNMTVDPSDYTVTKDETAGTVTIAAKEGSKNYTGSQTVKVNNVQIQTPVISGV